MSTALDPPFRLSPTDLVLALDAASPVVSVAVGRAGRALAVRSVELRRSSERLLGLLDEVLAEVGAAFSEVAAVVALAGPGSFTGLRVGLATALGCHQATGVRVAAVPTLAVLALAAERDSGRVWAAVDAIRGEWFAQPLALVPGEPPRPLAPAALVTGDFLAAQRPEVVVGFGLERLAASCAGERIVPRELASAALRLVALAPPAWDARPLSRPLYLREPEATVPAPRQAVGARA